MHFSIVQISMSHHLPVSQPVMSQLLQAWRCRDVESNMPMPDAKSNAFQPVNSPLRDSNPPVNSSVPSMGMLRQQQQQQVCSRGQKACGRACRYLDMLRLVEEARVANAVIFCTVQGGAGEAGELQGFLERSHIPFTGSAWQACQLCIDKVSMPIMQWAPRFGDSSMYQWQALIAQDGQGTGASCS